MKKLYTIWHNMIYRCNNPVGKNLCYKNITYIKEWEDYSIFKKWAINSGYKENLSIDRIDCNKNYCPENCRWIPIINQQRNKKGYGLSKYKGVIKSKILDYPWKAVCCINGVHKDLGNYKTEEAAAYAYDKYCLENNFEYSFLNNVSNEYEEAPYIRNTKSKYIGVKFNKSSKSKPWQARYGVYNGKDITIGCFSTELEAAIARDNYVKEHNLKVRRYNFD